MKELEFFHKKGDSLQIQINHIINTLVSELNLANLSKCIPEHLLSSQYNNTIITNKNVTKKISTFIDHTLLKSDITSDDISKLYEEADKYDFNCVCINPSWAGTTSQKTCCVVGFPLGANTIEIKQAEINDLGRHLGVREVDFVINIGKLKSKNYEHINRELEILSHEAKKFNLVTKAILETCLLTTEEIIIMCLLCYYHDIDFVKTSTGFSKSGADLESVLLMLYMYHGKRVKASGGIRDYKTAKMYIDLGVKRIGTSSGILIVEKSDDQNNYNNVGY